MSEKYLCNICGCDENHYEAIERIRELHTARYNNKNDCIHCGWNYPCPTIEALDGRSVK